METVEERLTEHRNRMRDLEMLYLNKKSEVENVENDDYDPLYWENK